MKNIYFVALNLFKKFFLPKKFKVNVFLNRSNYYMGGYDDLINHILRNLIEYN